jgi:release factor glutamine methyltransferase
MQNKGEDITCGSEALRWGASLLLPLGNDSQTAWLEASLLLGKACNKERIKLLTTLDDYLEATCWKDYKSYIQRRIEKEPLQYILEEQVFMSLSFRVTQDVLIPRGETELLVNEVLKLGSGIKRLRVLDLCTGSGAIAVSLAYYLPDCEIVAVDISSEAIEVARINAQKNGVDKRIRFLCSDMFSALEIDKFDIITCNPPYINALEYEELPLDVKKEPQLALYGGKDGLDFYYALAAGAHQFLKAQGILLMEIGSKQGNEVRKIMEGKGFADIRIIKDWNGHERIVTCTT